MKLGEAIVQLKTQLDQFKSGMKTAKDELTQLKDIVKKQSEEIKNSNSIFGGFVITLSDVRNAVRMISAPISDSIKKYAEFEKWLASVSTMLDSQSMKYMPEYSNAIRKLSVQYGESTKTLSMGLYDILSAAIPAGKALDVLEAGAKIAKAGFTTTATATKTLISVLNAYQLSGEKATDVSDWMFATVKRGVFTFEEFAGSIGKVLPLAKAGGVSLDELGAAMAVMTRAGLSADEATTALRGVISSMIAPSSESGKLIEEWGFKSGAAALKSLGLEGVLKKLSTTNVEYQSQIFGNVRALTGIMAALNDTAGFTEDLRSVTDRAGTTNEAFAKATDTLDFQMEQFKETLNEAQISIVEKFEPALKNLFKVAKEGIDTAKELDTFAQAYVKVLEDMANKQSKLTDVSGFTVIKNAIKETLNVSASLGKTAADYWSESMKDVVKAVKDSNRIIVNDSKKAGDEIVKNKKDDTDDIVAETVEEIAKRKKYQDDFLEYEIRTEKKSLSEYRKILKDKLSNIKKGTDDEIKLLNKLADVDKKLEDEKLAKKQKTMAAIQSTVSAFGGFLGQFQTYQSTLIQNELTEKLEANMLDYNNKKITLDQWLHDNLGAVESREGTEEEHIAWADEVNKEYAERMKALDEDKLRNEKKLNEEAKQEEARRRNELKPYLIAEAAANIALGITKAIAELGPFAWVAVPLIAAAGAFQIATIQAQKFAKGVKDFAGGFAVVGDVAGAGGELVHLPKGSDVYSNAESKEILGIGKNSSIINLGDVNINITGGVDKNNINEICRKISIAVKENTIEAIRMAKVINKEGGFRANEAY
jgi:TP901 family phage tail tape measure protein